MSQLRSATDNFETRVHKLGEYLEFVEEAIRAEPNEMARSLSVERMRHALTKLHNSVESLSDL